MRKGLSQSNISKMQFDESSYKRGEMVRGCIMIYAEAEPIDGSSSMDVIDHNSYSHMG